ncbi:Putative transposase, YhgA-like [Lachnospiraceae bacterium]|nr:Putative transposase, YhgA-like [Lachnospiraceae bacterium]
MPRPDEAIKKFLKDDKVYAAVFNGYFFNGKSVIDPEKLEKADTAYAEAIATNLKIEKINKYRDNVRRTSLGYLVILAIEDQDKIHYAMPIRKMLYDALGYSTEVSELGKTQDNRKWTVDEKLSKVSKGTKITPIMTVVLYTGEKKWDGPKSLYDMMDLDDEIKPFVPDYPLYVIDIGHDDELSFPNEELENLKITLSAIYSDTADTNETEIDGSIMALAGILSGDYKLYKAADYDGRQRMCKVLEARDERIKLEYDVKLREKDAVISEKDAVISEKDAALSEKDAEIERLKACIAELQK